MSVEDTFALHRIRKAQMAVDRCQEDVDLAKEAYKARKGELAIALRDLRRVIKAETSEAPLFDGMSRVEEDSRDGDEDAE